MSDSFMDTIIKKMKDLRSLQIQTIVGDFKIDPNTNKIIPDEKAKKIITRIDLLDGDVTTAFSEEFLKAPLNKVREFHAEREKEGHLIIDNNIKAVSSLIKLVIEATKNIEDT